MGQQEEPSTLARIKSEKSYNLINIVQNGSTENEVKEVKEVIEEIYIDQNESPSLRCTSREKKKKRLNTRSTNQ